MTARREPPPPGPSAAPTSADGPALTAVPTPAVPTPADAPAPAGLLYVVKQLELASRAHLDAVLKPSGVTALQYTAMTVLARRPAMTSADLARRSFVRAQSIADLVATLERRGLIAREPDPSHRRRLLIRLTDAGRAFLAEYDPLVETLERRMVAGLSASEQRQFRAALESCRRGLADPPEG